MKHAEATAKTREEAIQKALQELGVEMYEVERIEILDEGSKGILGFGARPVHVKVYVDQPELPRREREARPPARSAGNARPQEREGRAPARSGESSKPQEREGRATSRPPRTSERGPQRQAQRQTGQRASGNKPAPRQPRPAPHEPAANHEAQPVSEKRLKPEPVRAQEPAHRDEEAHAAPVTDAQGQDAAALLQEIISKMGIECAAAFVRSDDGVARINVASPDGALLIGRKGRTLGALQYIINRIINRGDATENSERVVVDVEGYVDRRREMLEDMALSFAARAKETRRNMRLKPLSPQERRIIHLTLQDDPDVRTFSHGDSLYRSVVISPKNALPERGPDSRKNAPQKRGNRNRGPRPDRRPPRQHNVEVDAGQFGD